MNIFKKLTCALLSSVFEKKSVWKCTFSRLYYAMMFFKQQNVFVAIQFIVLYWMTSLGLILFVVVKKSLNQHLPPQKNIPILFISGQVSFTKASIDLFYVGNLYTYLGYRAHSYSRNWILLQRTEFELGSHC